MSIATSVVAELNSFAGLVALVENRIYPVKAQAQAPYPYVVYSIVFGRPENSLGGWSGGDNVRMQFSCWATTYAQAHAISDQVRAALAQANVAYRSVCVGVLDGPVENGLDLYHVVTEFSLWTS